MTGKTPGDVGVETPTTANLSQRRSGSTLALQVGVADSYAQIARTRGSMLLPAALFAPTRDWFRRLLLM